MHTSITRDIAHEAAFRGESESTTSADVSTGMLERLFPLMMPEADHSCERYEPSIMTRPIR